MKQLCIELVETVGSKLKRKRKVLALMVVSAIVANCPIVRGTPKNEPRDASENHCSKDDSLAVLKRMNFSADPCDDFYNYACGGFERMNPSDNTYVVTHRDSVMEKTMKWIDSVVLGYEGTDEDILAMKAYLISCKNRDTHASISEKYMLDVISYMGGSQLLGNWDEAGWNLTSVLTKARNTYAVQPFFKLSKNSDNSFSLELNEINRLQFILNHELFGKTNHRYIAIKNILRRLQKNESACNEACVKDIADGVFAFEGKWFKALTECDSFDDSSTSITNFTFSDLNITQYMELTELFDSKTKIVTTRNTECVVENMAKLVVNSDRTHVHNFILWRLIIEYAETMGKSYVVDKQLDGYDGNSEVYEDYCYAKMRGYFYKKLNSLLQNQFKSTSKEEGSVLFDRAKTAFINSANIDLIDKSFYNWNWNNLTNMNNDCTDDKGLYETQMINLQNFLETSIAFSLTDLKNNVKRSNTSIRCRVVKQAVCPLYMWTYHWLSLNSNLAMTAGSLGVDIIQLLVPGRRAIFTHSIRKSNSEFKPLCVPKELRWEMYLIMKRMSNYGRNFDEIPIKDYTAWAIDTALELLPTNKQMSTGQCPIPGLTNLNDRQLFYLAYTQTMCASFNNFRDQNRWHIAVNTLLYYMDNFRNSFNCPPLNWYHNRFPKCFEQHWY